jgi:L-aminopeptidase/D-esterase-like protein
VFVQANFGSQLELTLAGVPVGRLLAEDNPVGSDTKAPPGAGSVIGIVATDAPLLPHQCTALARRVTHGIARTGTISSHFSGDLFLAFSTANPGGFSGYSPRPGAERDYDQLTFIPWAQMNPFFAAVVQATEEAVANALVANEEMTGRAGRRAPALPRDRVAGLFQPGR